MMERSYCRERKLGQVLILLSFPFAELNQQKETRRVHW